jgi:hypothetical protein
MEKKFSLSLLFLSVLFLFGCPPEKQKFGDLMLDIAHTKKVLDKIYPAEQCSGPKPEESCASLCSGKPCYTWICKNGNWEKFDMTPPSEICEGRNLTVCACVTTELGESSRPEGCSLCY